MEKAIGLSQNTSMMTVKTAWIEFLNKNPIVKSQSENGIPDL